MIDLDQPKITSSSQAMLRILEVGVCGTDQEICSFQYGSPPPGSEYLVIGHESLGEVVETGSGVAGIRRGDLIVTTIRRPCPHENCYPCVGDRADFCSTGDFSERGIKQQHGFMTEFIVDDACNMNVVPRALREVAVLIEPLTTAEKAIEQIRSLQARLPWACPHTKEKGMGHCHRAVVLGGGPVGLLGAMALVRHGFETFVYSRETAPHPRVSIAESIGVTYVSAHNASLDDLARTVGNIDVVYEASGASRLSFEVIQRLGVNGIFVFTGIPGGQTPIAIDTDRIMRSLVLNNQVVLGSVNASRANFQAAINDLAGFNESWPEAVSRTDYGALSCRAISRVADRIATRNQKCR